MRRLPLRSLKMEDFPKRKELASLRQLFVLHGKSSIFLYAPPLNAGVFAWIQISSELIILLQELHFF